MEPESESLQLVLTKEVLRNISPKELILADHFDPKQHSYGAMAKGPLGIGIEDAIPLLLPIVYSFFDGFIGELKKTIVDLGKDAAGALITKVTQSFRNKQKGDKVDKDDFEALIRSHFAQQGLGEDETARISRVISQVISEHAAKLNALK